MKRAVLAVIAVHLSWFVLDFIIHGVLLADAYAATSSLWRAEGEMRMGLMQVVYLLSAAASVGAYGLLGDRKNTAQAVKFGLLLGLVFGIRTGYGSFAVMPIPYHMAYTWFLGTVVQMTAGAWVMGAIVKCRSETECFNRSRMECHATNVARAAPVFVG